MDRCFEILESKYDHNYHISMPFNYSHIYEAMEQYAKEKVIEELEAINHLDCYVEDSPFYINERIEELKKELNGQKG